MEAQIWNDITEMGNQRVSQEEIENFCHSDIYGFLTPRGESYNWEQLLFNSEDLISIADREKYIDKSVWKRIMDVGTATSGYGELSMVCGQHYLILSILLSKWSLPINAVCMEIGGGYGNFARILDHMCAPKSWTIYDLNFVNELQHHYLAKHTERSIHRNSIQTGINLINRESRDHCKPVNEYDLLTAVHSLSALDMDEFQWYYDNVLPKAIHFLYVTQIGERCEQKMRMIEKLFRIEAKVLLKKKCYIILYSRKRIRYQIIHGLDQRRKQVMTKLLTDNGVNMRDVNWVLYPNKRNLTAEMKTKYTNNIHQIHQFQCVTIKHYLALRDIVENGYDYSVIMEDNLGYIDANVPEIVERCIAETPDGWSTIFGGDWMCYHDLDKENEDIWEPYEEGKLTYRKGNKTGGTRAANFFIITKECARKFYDNYLPFNHIPDHWMNHLLRKFDLKSYWVEPPIARVEDNHVSTCL